MSDEIAEVRERIVMALDGQPVNGPRGPGGWRTVLTLDKGEAERVADAVLDAMGLEQVGWFEPGGTAPDYEIVWKSVSDDTDPCWVPAFRLSGAYAEGGE